MNQKNYWSEMFVCSGSETPENHSYIISKDQPKEFESDKNIILEYYHHNKVPLDKYSEICDFIRKHNTMSTGNITLLDEKELSKYLQTENVTMIMRNQHNLIMGIIISILLPIKVGKNKIITHGCTTFLNVHTAIRNFGMCMALIRGLINYGYKHQIYCDYHLVPFKLGKNSIQINSFFRPINLTRCMLLGFSWPNCYDRSYNNQNRILFSTNLGKNLKVKKCGSYEEYLNYVKDLSFTYYPSKEEWNSFINIFDTYSIYEHSVLKGIFSFNTVKCLIRITQQEGYLCSPLLITGDPDLCLKGLFYLANKNNYDGVYIHQIGSLSEEILLKNNCLQTKTEDWFSLYNNSIQLESSQINVPFF